MIEMGTQTNIQHVVIVGGGLNAANSLRRAQVTVTLLDIRNFHLFQTLAYLIEYHNKLHVLFQWAWNYFTRKRGARLITGGDPFPLVPPRGENRRSQEE